MHTLDQRDRPADDVEVTPAMVAAVATILVETFQVGPYTARSMGVEISKAVLRAHEQL